MRRVPHDLLRHATHVDAGTSEPPRFDDGDAGAVFGGSLRRGQPAAPAADDDQIESIAIVLV
jgi:hypothetical protein